MLDHLIGKVIELTQVECRSAKAEIIYRAKSNDILLYVDESQISRIFINLVKNAIQAGAHHIVIEAEEGRDDRIKVSVCNDGIPITPESQQQIFIPSSPPRARAQASASACRAKSCGPTTAQ